MKTLSEFERATLWNQYEILKALYPADAASYEEKQEIVGNGFALAYPWLTESFIYEETSTAVCEEVMQILSMFRALDNAIHAGVAPATTPNGKFWGFDGNNEHDHLSFARFLIERQGKFTESAIPDLNSHSLTLDKYRRMLAAWGGAYSLTASDVTTITSA